MKAINYYICDYCGSRYDTVDECTSCEDSHVKPVNIVESKYEKLDDVNKCPHPYNIKIEMQDGQQVWYRRESH